MTPCEMFTSLPQEHQLAIATRVLTSMAPDRMSHLAELLDGEDAALEIFEGDPYHPGLRAKLFAWWGEAPLKLVLNHLGNGGFHTQLLTSLILTSVLSDKRFDNPMARRETEISILCGRDFGAHRAAVEEHTLFSHGYVFPPKVFYSSHWGHRLIISPSGLPAITHELDPRVARSLLQGLRAMYPEPWNLDANTALTQHYASAYSVLFPHTYSDPCPQHYPHIETGWARRPIVSAPLRAITTFVPPEDQVRSYIDAYPAGPRTGTPYTEADTAVISRMVSTILDRPHTVRLTDSGGLVIDPLPTTTAAQRELFRD